MPLRYLDAAAFAEVVGEVEALKASGALTLHSEKLVTVEYDGRNFGPGELSLTSDNVLWRSDSDASGFVVDYPTIVLHAICRDTTSYPQACIYCQLSGVNPTANEIPTCMSNGGATLVGGPPAATAEGTDENGEELDSNDEALKELRYIPHDAERLAVMFRVMSDMATLHPEADAAGLSESSADDEGRLVDQHGAEGDNVMQGGDWMPDEGVLDELESDPDSNNIEQCNAKQR